MKHIIVLTACSPLWQRLLFPQQGQLNNSWRPASWNPGSYYARFKLLWLRPVWSAWLHCNLCRRWHKRSASNFLFLRVIIWHKFRQKWVSRSDGVYAENPTCTQRSWESFLSTCSRRRKGRLSRRWLKWVRSSYLICWLPLKLKYYHQF